MNDGNCVISYCLAYYLKRWKEFEVHGISLLMLRIDEHYIFFKGYRNY
jgi:hypothetical protein